MKTVLVTGASGQLGKCLQELAEVETSLDWHFFDSSEIDITSEEDLDQCFKSKRIDYCINCAAYTNVEKAESETEKAYQINAEALKFLSLTCKKNRTVLIHISTDYVFDGRAVMPYTEEDHANPINVYGASKLKGEEYIQKILHEYFIIRTSWLYSDYGHNFYKTILKKATEGAVLNITTAQTGTPTNAHHLAIFILKIVLDKNKEYGIYNFSNSGETTWYGFAYEILKHSGNLDKVTLKKDNSYITVAPRPEYSVLDKDKLFRNFQILPASWQDALQELLIKEKLN